MKNILMSLIFNLIFQVTYSQSLTIDLYGDNGYDKISNAYYQDVTGFHDQFVGTWIFDSGRSYLKVVFKKKNGFQITNRLHFIMKTCLLESFNI